MQITFALGIFDHLFLLLYNLKIQSTAVGKALASISRRSLDMYLSSYMFDLIAYAWMMKHIYENQAQIGVWFFAIVPAVFFLSYIFSTILHSIMTLFHLPTK